MFRDFLGNLLSRHWGWVMVFFFFPFSNVKAAFLCQSVFSTKSFLLRSVSEVPRLRFMTYNLKDFRISFQDFQANAPRLERLGRKILHERADFILLQEVSDQNSLVIFNRIHLDNMYDVIFVPGIEGNNHNLAFLKKKGLLVRVELRSNLSQLWTNPITGQNEVLFFRDLPVFLIYQNEGVQPFLMIVGVHIKSMRNMDSDPKVAPLRQAQLEGVGRVVRRLWEEFGGPLPTIIGGDFNTPLQQERLLGDFSAQVVNAFEASPKTKTPVQRITHFSRYHGGSQLDGFFISPSLADYVISVRTVLGDYQDWVQDPKWIQQNRLSTFLRPGPSDHVPVIMDIRNPWYSGKKMVLLEGVEAPPPALGN